MATVSLPFTSPEEVADWESNIQGFVDGLGLEPLDLRSYGSLSSYYEGVSSAPSSSSPDAIDFLSSQPTSPADVQKGSDPSEDEDVPTSRPTPRTRGRNAKSSSLTTRTNTGKRKNGTGTTTAAGGGSKKRSATEKAADPLAYKRKHLISEQRRRDAIRERLDVIRDLIPETIAPADNKAAVLTKTIEHIQKLHQQRSELEQTITTLTTETKALKDHIAQLVAHISTLTEESRNIRTKLQNIGSIPLPTTPLPPPCIADLPATNSVSSSLSSPPSTAPVDMDVPAPSTAVEPTPRAQQQASEDATSGWEPLAGQASEDSVWLSFLGDGKRIMTVMLVACLLFFNPSDGEVPHASLGRALLSWDTWSSPPALAQLFCTVFAVLRLTIFGLVSLCIALVIFYLRDTVVQPNSDAFRRARKERLRADAFGMLEDTLQERHAVYSKSLALLGRPMPRTQLGVHFGVVVEVVRQLLHTTSLGLWMDRIVTNARRGNEAAMEAASAYVGISSIYTRSDEQSAMGLYTLLASLNMAECAGPSQKLADIYGKVALFTEFHDFMRWARPYYVRRCQEVAAATCKGSVLLDLLSGYKQCVIGNWGEGMEILFHCVQESGSHHLCDCYYWCSMLLMLQGKFILASKLSAKAYAYAAMHGSHLEQLRSLTALAYAFLGLGETERAKAVLDRATPLALKPNLHRELVVMVHRALLARVTYLRGEKALAVQCAREATALASGSEYRHATHSCGIGLVALTHLNLWEDALKEAECNGHTDALLEESVLQETQSMMEVGPSGEQRARGLSGDALVLSLHRFSREMARITHKDLVNLRRLCYDCPIVLPTFYRLRGKYYGLLGNPEKALKCFRRAYQATQELQMPHEEQLTVMEMTRFSERVHMNRFPDALSGSGDL